MLKHPILKSRYNHPVVRANHWPGSPLSAIYLASLPSQSEVPAEIVE